MLLIYGTRRTERQLGFVADFCPMCRKPTPCRLVRIGMVSHLYGISIGAGKLAGHIAECMVCKVQIETEAERYREPLKAFDVREAASSVRVQQLVAQTFPSLPEHYGKRLELEQRLLREPQSIDPDTRRALIMEPFELLAVKVGRRLEHTHLDWPLVITAIVAFLVVLGALALSDQMLGPQGAEITALVGVGTTLIAIAAVVIQAKLGTRRYVRREVLLQAMTSLKPMRAGVAEIESALAVLRKSGSLVAKRISARDLAAFAPEPQRAGAARR